MHRAGGSNVETDGADGAGVETDGAAGRGGKFRGMRQLTKGVGAVRAVRETPGCSAGTHTF